EDPPPEVPMADNRTMAELLQAPTEGYEDAIVIPEITANNFELKHGLINLVQNKQFFGHDKEDPHAHIRYFNKITSTMRFFPPSKTTKLRNEIMRFQQRFDESFYKAWERFNDLLRACSHHGFSGVHQLDTFYNALNVNDQDSLNSAASGNFLDKMPRECLKIIDSKSKVRQSRAKEVVAKVSTSSSTSAISSDVAELKDMVKALLLDKKNQSPAPTPSSTPAPVKAVDPNCVSYGVSAPMPNLKPFILYPSRRDNEKRRDQANEQIKKFYEIFKDMSFEVSFTDALILMPKFASTLKYLIGNKEKLNEMVRTTMNEHCSAVILNKLPRKLGDPADFVVVDFEPDPRVPLILKRCFLKTSRALIDVHKGELTLRIRNEAITYNLDQTMRYSANYNQMTANKIDVIESACEEYSQEVLGFSNVTAGGTSTPHNDPIVSATSPTLTPFGDSYFLLFEEADAFLGLEDDPNSPKINSFYYDPEGDILLLEAILNKFKLKDLSHHLEYAFLEGDNKLSVIIAKELGDEEKSALIKVLKSHKPAIAWKLSDIQSINLEFYTHKILMEEDYKPAVQHQRRVNPKIHDVIKKVVEKLLDVGLIYLISDSPWFSPVHCVPKKGGFTVVENEENELIPTRLVTGWRVCIDYRKLNEATRKDHIPLPFMDQMLKRLAGNKYYCFLDGFSGYFKIPIDPRD
nr:reverse transcriptase domain-containing protein [Tanacetum cinerariifolium]